MGKRGGKKGKEAEGEAKEGEGGRRSEYQLYQFGFNRGDNRLPIRSHQR